MTSRRTLLVALAALALVTSAAALSSPSDAQTDSDAGSQGQQTSSHGGDGNGTEGSDGNGSRDGAGDGSSGRSGHDGSGPEGRDDRDRGPERTGPERRDVRVEVDENRAEFRSESRDGDRRSELRLEIRGEDASIRLDFENRTDEGRTELEMETRHAVLQEFRDADGDGAIDPDEPVVQRVDLRDRDPAVAVNETPVGPRVTTTYALPGNGTFSVEVLLASGPARVGGQSLTPDEAKVDYRIDGFPFQANETRLALQVEVEAASEVRGAAGADGVTLHGGDAAGYYRWVPNATVDGNRTEVVPRVTALQATSEDGESETEHVIQLAYAQGETIVHDPTFGVESVEEAAQAVRETLGDLPTYAVAAGATAILAVGIAYVRSRGPR